MVKIKTIKKIYTDQIRERKLEALIAFEMGVFIGTVKKWLRGNDENCECALLYPSCLALIASLLFVEESELLEIK